MTDVNLPDNIKTASDLAAEDSKLRLERARQRADVMGISYSPNAKAETIEAKIKEKMDMDVTTVTSAPTDAVSNRKKIIDANMALVRINYTNMHPDKTERRGEFITVVNDFIGSVTKFVPYGVDTPVDGYHVPYCIYKEMRDKEFVIHKQIKNPQTGKLVMKATRAKEYSISVLPPLTEEELQVIADRQNSNGTIG